MQNKKKSSEHSIAYNLSNIDHYGIVKFTSGKEVEVTISAFSDFEITTDSLQVMIGDENYFNDCSVTYIKDSYGKNASARIIIPKDITSKKKDILIVASAKRYIANVNYMLTGVTASIKPDRFIIGEPLSITLDANESYEILTNNISITSNESNVDYTYETTEINNRTASIKLNINTNNLSDNITITAIAAAYDSTFEISYNFENIEIISCPSEAVVGTEVNISFKAEEGYSIKTSNIIISTNGLDVTSNCSISNDGQNATITIPQNITADGYDFIINASAVVLNINYNLEYCNIVYPYNPNTYIPGDIVTIQIDADGYYSLNNISITDEYGNTIDGNITYTSDNEYNVSAMIEVSTNADMGNINVLATASKYIYYMRDELVNMKDKSSTYTIFSMGSTASTIFEAKESCEIIKDNIKAYYDDGSSRIEITPTEIKELEYTDDRLTKVEVIFDGTITNHNSDIVVVAEAIPYVNEYTITYDFDREIYGSGYPDELTILHGETFDKTFATEWGTQPYYGNEIVYQTIDIDSFKVVIGGEELNKDLYEINITSYANQVDTNYPDQIGPTGINVVIDGQYITGDVIVSMTANKYSKVDMQISGISVITTIDNVETTYTENTYKYYPFGNILIRYNNDNNNLVNTVNITSGDKTITLKESNVEFNIDSYTTSIVAVATQLYNIVVNNSNCEVSMLAQFEPGNKLPVSITANDMCYFKENSITVSNGIMSNMSWSTNDDELNNKVEFNLDTTNVYEDIILTATADSYSRYAVNTTLPDYVNSSNDSTSILSINDYETTLTSLWNDSDIFRYDAIDIDNIIVKSGSNTLSKSQYEIIGENTVSTNDETLYTSAILKIPASSMSGDISITVNVLRYGKLFVSEVKNGQIFVNDKEVDEDFVSIIPLYSTFTARYTVNDNCRVANTNLSPENSTYTMPYDGIYGLQFVAIEQITITMNSKLAVNTGENISGTFYYKNNPVESIVIDKESSIGSRPTESGDYLYFEAPEGYVASQATVMTGSTTIGGDSYYTFVDDMSNYEGMYNKIYFHFAVNVLTDNTTIDVSLIKMGDTTANEYTMEATLMNDTSKSVEMVANTISHDGQVSTDSPDNLLDGDGYGKDLKEMFDIYDNGEYRTYYRNLISITKDSYGYEYNGWNNTPMYYAVAPNSNVKSTVSSIVLNKDGLKYTTFNGGSYPHNAGSYYGIMVKVKLDKSDSTSYALKVNNGANDSGMLNFKLLPIYDNIENDNRYLAFFVNHKDRTDLIMFTDGYTSQCTFKLTTDTSNAVYPTPNNG